MVVAGLKRMAFLLLAIILIVVGVKGILGSAIGAILAPELMTDTDPGN